ncbi:MAG: phenylacetate--CoA ligase family protein [Syntrophobacteraceae bacterium]
MSWRKHLYFSALSLKGIKTFKYLKQFQSHDFLHCGADILRSSLTNILKHCVKHVRYYSRLLNGISTRIESDPFEALSLLPILDKSIIKANFEEIKSNDLNSRKWFFNTSGGSTGEPVRLIQDKYHQEMTNAIAELFSTWAGFELGNPKILLWGSERDILEGKKSIKSSIINTLSNTILLNAFLMTPEQMRAYIDVINTSQKTIIVAYAQAIYELATYANRKHINVKSPISIITSAGTLYPFMREKIEQIFKCPVYNRYGSREAGLIAAERPNFDGMLVPPWGTYVEVVDSNGNKLPPGTEGDIVVTSLTNYSMPMLRYSIGDRGIAMANDPLLGYQRIKKITGRTVDAFIRTDGTLIDGEFFTHLLYFRDYVDKFQVVQNNYDEITYRIATTHGDRLREDSLEITDKTRKAMGYSCSVNFEIVDELLPSHSGKYRYTISLIPREIIG